MAAPEDAPEELRRRADAITNRLLYGDEAEIDLEIAINELREYVREVMPERLWLFRRIYEARWRRLREQGWAHCPAEPWRATEP